MASVEFEDDPTIPDGAQLLGRVPKNHLVPDPTTRCYRISSQAFEDRPDGSLMSVVLADVLRREGRGLETVLVGHPDFSLVAITTRLARNCGQKVRRDLEPEGAAHAVVVGKKTERVRKKFAKNARWVISSCPPRVS
jgi:hypothetical protein